MDWLAYIEHLQPIIQEFDNAAALTNDVLIRYFQDGMRPSIRAQMDKRNQELNNWQAGVERAVDGEAKAAKQTPLLAWESNTRCPRGHKPLPNEKKDHED